MSQGVTAENPGSYMLAQLSAELARDPQTRARKGRLKRDNDRTLTEALVDKERSHIDTLVSVRNDEAYRYSGSYGREGA